jgi:Flp pilus assembly protein TadG
MVEFAIVVPLLILLLCGTIDFGLIFNGDMEMQSGIAGATRQLALDNYQFAGTTATCTGGPTPATANAVCNVVASLGSMTGLNSSTLAVGICFAAPGASLSCGGGSPQPGMSVTDDVVVCAQAQMESVTGLTSIFVSGSTVYTSSRLLMEEPQPSNQTAFDSYNNAPTSPTVYYNGTAVPGLTCT